ncbi:MAG TPA: Hsp20/alpha crystallin family protein [Candidatus Limnocylindria bacterium]|jgi:HSP20 family protein
MTLARYTPISDFMSLRDAMDQLFQDSFIRPTTLTGLAAGQIAVPIDLWETPDAYHVRADLPGLTPNDIDINVTGATLQLSGELKPATDAAVDGWLRQERRVGKFRRALALPIQIESAKVEATFKDGVLDLILPKAESVRPRTVRINAK